MYFSIVFFVFLYFCICAGVMGLCNQVVLTTKNTEDSHFHLQQQWEETNLFLKEHDQIVYYRLL